MDKSNYRTKIKNKIFKKKFFSIFGPLSAHFAPPKIFEKKKSVK
jgi:hypothetical protein